MVQRIIFLSKISKNREKQSKKAVVGCTISGRIRTQAAFFALDKGKPAIRRTGPETSRQMAKMAKMVKMAKEKFCHTSCLAASLLMDPANHNSMRQVNFARRTLKHLKHIRIICWV